MLSCMFAAHLLTLQQHEHQDRILVMMKVNSGFSGAFILLLILSTTGSGLGSVVSKYYTYIASHYTWQDAQSYCKRYYTDLAIIFTQSDEDDMHMPYYHAWIGLHRTSSSSSVWMWSDGELTYPNIWGDREPHSSETCATIYYTLKKFYGNSCQGLFFFFCHKRHPNHYEFKFISQSKSWSDAQLYCRTVYDDLATFEDTGDVNSAVIGQDFPVWTGLYKDAGTWKWSAGLSEYRNWASGSPGNGNCAFIFSSSKNMSTHDCSTRFPFICFRDNLILVKENKTWEEALEHCRALQYELVSVQPGEDHSYVMNKVKEADTEEVWAGLRFLAGQWLWVNRASLSYPDLPVCPPVEQHCGALSKNYTDGVEVADCSEKRNFLCYS